MRKAWVLDTATKGTGAEMVPLETVLTKPAREPELSLVELNRAAPAKVAPEPESHRPRQFRIVDVMTREVLAEGASTRTTVDLLEQTRSIVDVQIAVWEPTAELWRPLTLAEQRTLWEFRGRGAGAPAARTPA
jgi:hypothetical protein